MPVYGGVGGWVGWGLLYVHEPHDHAYLDVVR